MLGADDVLSIDAVEVAKRFLKGRMILRVAPPMCRPKPASSTKYININKYIYIYTHTYRERKTERERERE